MVASVRLMPLEEAKQTRRPKTVGVRRQRMDRFDEYVRPLLDAGENEALVYEELGENPQKFVLSLRGAFKRAGLDATVRKLRGRDEVRAWRNAPKPKAKAKGRSARRKQAVSA